VLLRDGVEPWTVAKFSGIGCSSKSPAYFLNLAHGFNSVHGRAPSIATGALLANRNLFGITVSGDGDTASIGIGSSYTCCGATCGRFTSSRTTESTA